MNENLKAFLRKASEDDALKASLDEINDSVMSNAKTKFIKLAKENGFAFTEEDMDHVTVESEKLSEDELNAVAGGEFEPKGKKGTLCCNCVCVLGGGGTADEYQKTCACVAAGCGELTALGKEKAEKGELGWSGKASAKVAMYCAIAGAGAEPKHKTRIR